jgi:hypothetical protein
VNCHGTGRFSGYRVNCEFVPCLPARVVAACLADVRRIPYLLIWTRRPLPIERVLATAPMPMELRDAVRLAPYPSPSGVPLQGWAEIKRWDGTQIGLRVLTRPLPRHGGKDVLLVCNRCEKQRRMLYGREANKYARCTKRTEWLCRKCADLSYASEGGALIYRTRWAVLRKRSGLFSQPRPEPWEPLVFTSPIEALGTGRVQSVWLQWAAGMQTPRLKGKHGNASRNDSGDLGITEFQELLKVLAEQEHATKKLYFRHKGVVKELREVPDHDSKLRALDALAEIYSLYPQS